MWRISLKDVNVILREPYITASGEHNRQQVGVDEDVVGLRGLQAVLELVLRDICRNESKGDGLREQCVGQGYIVLGTKVGKTQSFLR